MLTGPDKKLFVGYSFHTSREYIENELSKHFPSPSYQRHKFIKLDSERKEFESSVLVFDMKQNIIEEVVQNKHLLYDNSLALNPETKWVKNIPVQNANGDYDLSDIVSGKAYRKAYDKLITRNDQLLVPFACWLDETGITQQLTKPVQPLLIKSLLPKRPFQKYRIWSYIPCDVQSKAEKGGSSLAKGINEDNFHRALTVVFEQFNQTVEYFAKNPQLVHLGNSKKSVIIVPVILLVLGDHKSNQMNTRRHGKYTGICVKCSNAFIWNADNEHEDVNSFLDGIIVEKINKEIISDREREYILKTKTISNPMADEKIKLGNLKVNIKSNVQQLTKYNINPGLLGFFLRPTTVIRNTYENIKTVECDPQKY